MISLSLVHGLRWTGVSLKKEQALCVYHQIGTSGC